jgi:hypothetical protein
MFTTLMTTFVIENIVTVSNSSKSFFFNRIRKSLKNFNSLFNSLDNIISKACFKNKNGNFEAQTLEKKVEEIQSLTEELENF